MSEEVQTKKAIDIKKLLKSVLAYGSSDLHLVVGSEPQIRIDKELRPLNLPVLNAKDVEEMAYSLIEDKQKKVFEEYNELDFSFELKNIGRFRANYYRTIHGIACAFRMIPIEIPTLDEYNNKPIFKQLVKKEKGLILVTGPTGSGKSTTLASMLHEINMTERRHIITVEDPVEYQLRGVNQIQVNPKIGMTFANGLRSIVRQDPDVILVGEIRDRETAEIAIQSALTGHLLFSTLHTNDAPGAVTRLLEIGVENFLLSSTLLGVLAQRLVRVICTGCKEEIRPDERLLNAMGLSNDEAADLHFFTGKGCEECRHTGYKGRIGIFEYLPMDSEVKAEIMKGSSTEAIREAGIDKGMITLRQDGWFKVLRGITTISEVLRVTVEK